MRNGCTFENGAGNCVWNPTTNRSLAEEFGEWLEADLKKVNEPAQRAKTPWVVSVAHKGWYPLRSLLLLRASQIRMGFLRALGLLIEAAVSGAGTCSQAAISRTLTIWRTSTASISTSLDTFTRSYSVSTQCKPQSLRSV